MEYTRTFERTFSAGAEPSLRIANRRGELVIRAEDRDDIVFTGLLLVDAASAEEAEERLAAVELPMEQHGESVEIGPPEYSEGETVRIFGFAIPTQWRGPRLDMAVSVPRKCRVHAEHRTGLTRIDGVHAEVRIVARSGRIQLSGIEGPLDVEGRTGKVEVRSVRGRVRVSTRTGRVEVEDVTGNTTLSTRTGATTARAVSGALSCASRTGSIRAVDCDGPFDLSARTGAVEYRGRVAHEGSIDVRTGRITLAVTRDSSFFIDAESRRGSVRSELSVDDMREPQEGAPTVRLRTEVGSIRIIPA